MKVAVFGLGYVGTVTAAVLADNGHEVRAVDVDASKVTMINAGTSPVVEPGVNELVAATKSIGTLWATSEAEAALEGAELSLICVGTPSSSTGSTDLEYVRRAVEEIARIKGRDAEARHHSIIVRSTIPPGTIDEIVAPTIARFAGEGSDHIGVGMCPEFLREGTALADFYTSPLTVLGTHDDAVSDAVRELLDFLSEPVRVVEPRVAEALKYACNAFHATKISFANEMGRLLRELGVDAREVMDVFCEDTKLNISEQYLAPGFAFGGSCLPKDLRSLLYLARMNSLDLPMLSGVLSTNSLAVSTVIDRVVASGARTVALLGLSFKMLSDDLRESPYVVLAEALIGKGFDVRIYDPIVEPSRLIGANRHYVDSKLPHLRGLMSSDPSVALDGADLALVSSSDAAVVAALSADPPATVIDLSGKLGEGVEMIPGYEGVAWELPGRPGGGSLLVEPHLAPTASASAHDAESEAGPPQQTGVLIIVQNLHVPFDRRVWLECQALRDNGYAVSVVCPKGPDDPKEQVIDGITVYKYKPHADGTGFAAFVSEYVYSFVATAWLVAKAWRRRRFQILQACNPPDIFWPLALLLRLRGVRFIFDHHDLCPELYESRFSDGPRAIYWALRALEWCTYRTADHVVSTNGSYRDIAIRRGSKREDEVTVVRTGPDPTQLKAQTPDPELRRGRPHLVTYLGVMGPQDGVDLALRAANHIVYDLGRHDISFTLMGSGDSMSDLLALREELKLEEFVELPGRVPDSYVAAVLSTADVALCPDPKNPLNDLSTMNKTMEYMAFGVPVVAFDLLETRVSAKDAALYARPNLIEDFAEKVVTLIDDKQLRDEMGAAGRRRVEDTLAWSHQRANYLGVYNSVVPPFRTVSNGR